MDHIDFKNSLDNFVRKYFTFENMPKIKCNSKYSNIEI